MALFGEIASGAGTILSGASSFISGIGAGRRQRRAQKWMEKMNKQNQQFQKDYAKYQNDLERENQALYWQKYNSPSAQRSAMEAAGINPFVEGSVMQPMQADSSVSGGGSPGFPTPPDYVTSGLGAIQDFGSSLSTLGARLDSIKADTELKNAQAAKVQSETIAQNNVNSIFDLTKAITEFDFLSKKYKTAVDKLNAEWAPIEKMQDAVEKQAAIEELRSRYTKQLAEAAKTDADREINKVLSDKLGKVYEADANLKGEQAKTEGAKREDLGASADYRRVLSSVETAKLPAFLDEVKARISKINAERLTESQRALLTQYEADIKRALARHEEGEMREILRKIETTGESLWSLIVPKLFGN
nr:MAG TPA: DNA pilot protein VP2 [Microviridae sp.]